MRRRAWCWMCVSVCACRVLGSWSPSVCCGLRVPSPVSARLGHGAAAPLNTFGLQALFCRACGGLLPSLACMRATRTCADTTALTPLRTCVGMAAPVACCLGAAVPAANTASLSGSWLTA